MTEHEKGWIDRLSVDDLRSRLMSAPTDPKPSRKAPKKQKKSRQLFRRPIPATLKNPVSKEGKKKVEFSINVAVPRLRVKKLTKKYLGSAKGKVIAVVAIVIARGALRLSGSLSR